MLAIVKSKLKNKMLTEIVDAIIAVRYGILYENSTCYDYIDKLPDEVLCQIGSSEKYVTDTELNYDEIYQIFVDVDNN